MLYFFIFLINFKSYQLTYLVIPFNTHPIIEDNSNNEFNVTKFYNSYFKNKIYAEINIGTPPKYITMDILLNYHGFLIGDLCQQDHDFSSHLKSTYDKSLSSTFFKYTDREAVPVAKMMGAYVKDSFEFFTDLEQKNQITLTNISFMYLFKQGHYYKEKNEILKLCGRFGLSASPSDFATGEVNFIKGLKQNNKLSKYDFSLYFINDDSGFLIIGEKPHIALPFLYDEKDLRIADIIPGPYHNEIYFWKTPFEKIYYSFNGNEQDIKEGKNGFFSSEYKYIIGTESYKKSIEDTFFKEYLDKKICYYEFFKNELRSVLICNKKDGFSPNSFPTLYFYSKAFDYTFELTKEELFLEKNDKYIFLIIFRLNEHEHFVLGKMFLRKYLFTFNSY